MPSSRLLYIAPASGHRCADQWTWRASQCPPLRQPVDTLRQPVDARALTSRHFAIAIGQHLTNRKSSIKGRDASRRRHPAPEPSRSACGPGRPRPGQRPARHHPLHSGRPRRLPLRIGERHEEFIKVENPAGLLGTPPVQAHLRSSLAPGPPAPLRGRRSAQEDAFAPLHGASSGPAVHDLPSRTAPRSAPGPAPSTRGRRWAGGRRAAKPSEGQAAQPTWCIFRAGYARSFFAHDHSATSIWGINLVDVYCVASRKF